MSTPTDAEWEEWARARLSRSIRAARCWGAGKFPDHTDALAGRVRCRGCQRWVDSPDGSVPEHAE